MSTFSCLCGRNMSNYQKRPWSVANGSLSFLYMRIFGVQYGDILHLVTIYEIRKAVHTHSLCQSLNAFNWLPFKRRENSKLQDGEWVESDFSLKSEGVSRSLFILCGIALSISVSASYRTFKQPFQFDTSSIMRDAVWHTHWIQIDKGNNYGVCYCFTSSIIKIKMF